MKAKFKSAKDFRKSLEARLQRHAKEKNIDLQRVRRQVAFDRLLARLFSDSNPPFFLKGGYAMELRLSSARATKDIDLTYLDRIQNTGELLPDLILNELQSLAAVDLGDFFSYTLGSPMFDLDNAPYGGSRFPVFSHIDGKLFVRFHLDVGGDFLVSNTEIQKTPDWLNFCGIPGQNVRIISVEQQIAEKIHAYTLPRKTKVNSRVKDLIDILLLMDMRQLDSNKLAFVLDKIFKNRNTHSLPTFLPTPPIEWSSPYAAMAEECGLDNNLTTAYRKLARIYPIIKEKVNEF